MTASSIRQTMLTAKRDRQQVIQRRHLGVTLPARNLAHLATTDVTLPLIALKYGLGLHLINDNREKSSSSYVSVPLESVWIFDVLSNLGAILAAIFAASMFHESLATDSTISVSN
jgi:hypothetical protein